mgnify:CR=1 FL=1
MATTRMRVNTSIQVYHRNAASGDMAENDTGTTDSNAQGLGGSGDFQIEADSTLTYTDSSKVQDTSAAAIGSAAIDKFIYIEHAGFTTAGKTVASTATLTVGLTGATAAGFGLEAGESICLHGLNSNNNNLSEIYLDSSSGDIYVKVIHH